MITLVKDIKDANCITHSGTMHADEIFATAFLELYKDNIKLFRTNNPTGNDKAIIYDIGKGKFDHHQLDAKVRENGIKYCAFGLLWEEYGKKYLKDLEIEDIDEVYDYFIKDFVEQIDAIDNGVFPKIEAKFKVKTLSDIFKLFNPSSFSDEDENTQFLKAENLAKIILEEEILNCVGKVKTSNIINELIEKNKNKTFLILDKYMPYEEFLISNEKANDILFVIYPSNREGYCIKTVPKSTTDKSTRLDFPKNWGGLTDEELERESGIEGLTFCHATLFLAVAKDLETAIKVVNKAIEEKK